jgi:hypothetical protein
MLHRKSLIYARTLPHRERLAFARFGHLSARSLPTAGHTPLYLLRLAYSPVFVSLLQDEECLFLLTLV